MNANYDDQVTKEALLYILSKEGKVRYYALMKTLYLAERDHLAQWGGRITTDVYHPLPYGPVPTRIYDALKASGSSFLSDVLKVSNDVVTALREPNMDYLSRSEVYALDRAIQFVKTHDFDQIKTATHDRFYYEAKAEHRPMTIEEMALSGGATPEMVRYIDDQLAVEKALRQDMIQIGDIYLIKADETNDITPKGGMPYRAKFFVVVGFDSSGNVYGGVVFDSEINRDHVPPMMSEFFLPIKKEEYSFLTHDSYIDCSKLKPSALGKLTEGQLKGTLKQVHMDEVKRLVCMSPRESFMHLRTYGLK